MKVMFTTAAPDIGGILTDITNLCCGLIEEGEILPEICCLGPCDQRLGEPFESRGISFHRVQCPMKNHVQFTREFARILKAAAPDILDIWSHLSLMGQTIAARIARVPAVTTRTYYYSPRIKTRLARCIQTLAPLRLIHSYTAISHAAASATTMAAKMAGTRVKVIYNGVDLNRFSTRCLSQHDARVYLGLPEHGFIIGSIGRLSPEKGFPVLLRAAAQVLTARQDVTLAIGGGGRKALPELIGLAETLGIRDRTIFIGWIGEPEKFYRALDTLVVPSLSEGLCNVVLEGMASGLPIIASNVGGIPEALGDAGKLVPPGKADPLAAAIIEVASDERLRAEMSEKALRQAQRFSVKSFVEAHVSLYQELYEKKVLHRRHVRH